MVRQIVTAVLFVSFVAMASSGLTMLVAARPSFTMQMHPVHKVFGMLMVAAVFAHLVFNGRTLLARLKAGASVVSAGAFTVALVLLYSAALMRPMPGVVAASLDTLAGQVEVLQESRPNAAALPAASMP